MQRSFPIKFGLMVGVGGGVYTKKNDIRLGDIVISQPTGAYGGVVQWAFQRTGSLNKPPAVLLHALQELKMSDIKLRVDIEGTITLMVQNNPPMGDTSR
jgi:nucleoside phosphorylase